MAGLLVLVNPTAIAPARIQVGRSAVCTFPPATCSVEDSSNGLSYVQLGSRSKLSPVKHPDSRCWWWGWTDRTGQRVWLVLRQRVMKVCVDHRIGQRLLPQRLQGTRNSIRQQCRGARTSALGLEGGRVRACCI